MDKLLLVEDDPTLIRILTSFLSDENFQISSVTGQQAAAAAMEADKPDLALVDISLAEGNGLPSVQMQKNWVYLLFFLLHPVMNLV